MNQSHEFALYITESQFINFNANDVYAIFDEKIYHRVVRILRLEIEDKLILFNKQFNFLVKLLEIDKKTIKIEVLNKNKNRELIPKITVCPSLLKREAFEEAIYACCELGANIIQPIVTKKIQARWSEKDKLRLQNIIISAAEQSKNYNFPELNDPIELQRFLTNFKKTNVFKLFLDFKGQPLNSVLESIKIQKIDELLILIGPEGDLNNEEKDILKQFDFNFCKLTPTILRSQTAIQVSLGIFRSLI